MKKENSAEELKLDVLDPREEMQIAGCKWDNDPKTQTCWLGDQPGEG